MTDPKTLYLEPKCQAGEEGQMWCEDDIWSGRCDVCDYDKDGEPQMHTATQYVRVEKEG